MTIEDAREATLVALDWVGDVAGAAASRGGVAGVGALAVAALAKGTAQAMRVHGLSVDEVLSRIREPRKLQMPWTDREV